MSQNNLQLPAAPPSLLEHPLVVSQGRGLVASEQQFILKDYRAESTEPPVDLNVVIAEGWNVVGEYPNAESGHLVASIRLRRVGSPVRSVVIHNSTLGASAVKELFRELSDFHKLVTLKFDSFKLLLPSTLDPIREHCLFQGKFPKLSTFTLIGNEHAPVGLLNSSTSLKAVTLLGPFTLDEFDLKNLVRHLPYLKHLAVLVKNGGQASATILNELLEIVEAEDGSDAPHPLDCLALDLGGEGIGELLKVVKYLPELRHLVLVHVGALAVDELKRLRVACPELETLFLFVGHGVTAVPWPFSRTQAMSVLKTFKKLRILGWDIEHITKGAPLDALAAATAIFKRLRHHSSDGMMCDLSGGSQLALVPRRTTMNEAVTAFLSV
ncbi:hypothetical protein JCM3775_002641 [Rhodotorula graminis]